MIQRPCGTYKKKGGNACKFISFNNASVTPERSLYLSLIDSLSGIIITWAFVCALQLQTHLSFPCPQLLIMCQRATDKKKSNNRTSQILIDIHAEILQPHDTLQWLTCSLREKCPTSSIQSHLRLGQVHARGITCNLQSQMQVTAYTVTCI